MNNARKLHNLWIKAKREGLEKLRAQYPHAFYEVFHMLPDNALIDFVSAIFHPEEIAKELDELGIRAFSISGGWSGAQETLARFEACGFKLDGLVMVSTQGDEKVPAFHLRKAGTRRIKGV